MSESQKPATHGRVKVGVRPYGGRTFPIDSIRKSPDGRVTIELLVNMAGDGYGKDVRIYDPTDVELVTKTTSGKGARVRLNKSNNATHALAEIYAQPTDLRQLVSEQRTRMQEKNNAQSDGHDVIEHDRKDDTTAGAS